MISIAVPVYRIPHYPAICETVKIEQKEQKSVDRKQTIPKKKTPHNSIQVLGSIEYGAKVMVPLING